MRGLALRASSQFPRSVTCRGGIRTRHTRHGLLPLNCKAMPVVEAPGANSARPRPGRCPEHSERRYARSAARQADCPEPRLSRLPLWIRYPLRNLLRIWQGSTESRRFGPTVFCLPLIRRHTFVSTSHIGLRNSSELPGPLSDGSQGRTLPWSLSRALHVAGCRHDRLAIWEP